MYITQNKKGIVATVMRNLGDLYQDIGQQNHAIEAYEKPFSLTLTMQRHITILGFYITL